MEPARSFLKQRENALRILGQVLSAEASFEELRSNFPESERAWLSEVCLGSLRYLGRLEWILSEFSEKKPSGWTKRLLVLAAYQILHTDVESAIVISESVELAKKKMGPSSSGYVNAVLRKISDANLEILEKRAPPWAWDSLPEWFWLALCDGRGEKWTRDFAQASLGRAENWVVSKDDLKPRKWSGGELLRTEYVQDLSNLLLIEEISAFLKEKGLKRGLDYCASPGGKSIGLSWRGFQIDAMEKNTERLPRLEENLNRCTNGEISVLEFSESEDLSQYDFVWVDAPCSSSGLIRRRPEIRWTRSKEKLSDYARAEREIVASVMGRMRKGAVLVYSVCSVFVEEGEGVLDSQKCLREWVLGPHLQPHGDGFYGALIEV